jgi:hypothetical protein
MSLDIPELAHSPFEKVTTICQMIDNYSQMNEPITLQGKQRKARLTQARKQFVPCKSVGSEIMLQQMDANRGKATIVKKYVRYKRLDTRTLTR